MLHNVDNSQNVPQQQVMPPVVQSQGDDILGLGERLMADYDVSFNQPEESNLESHVVSSESHLISQKELDSNVLAVGNLTELSDEELERLIQLEIEKEMQAGGENSEVLEMDVGVSLKEADPPGLPEDSESQERGQIQNGILGLMQNVQGINDFLEVQQAENKLESLSDKLKEVFSQHPTRVLIVYANGRSISGLKASEKDFNNAVGYFYDDDKGNSHACLNPGVDSSKIYRPDGSPVKFTSVIRLSAADMQTLRKTVLKAVQEYRAAEQEKAKEKTITDILADGKIYHPLRELAAVASRDDAPSAGLVKDIVDIVLCSLLSGRRSERERVAERREEIREEQKIETRRADLKKQIEKDSVKTDSLRQEVRAFVIKMKSLAESDVRKFTEILEYVKGDHRISPEFRAAARVVEQLQAA